MASDLTSVIGTTSATTDAANLATWRALGRKLDAQDPRVVRQAATQMLSEVFFGPLLAQMREFPLGRDLAVGGRTEAAFGQQLDQRLADTVAGSSTALMQQVLERMGGGRNSKVQQATSKTAGGAVLSGAAWWPAAVQSQAVHGKEAA